MTQAEKEQSNHRDTPSQAPATTERASAGGAPTAALRGLGFDDQTAALAPVQRRSAGPSVPHLDTIQGAFAAQAAPALGSAVQRRAVQKVAREQPRTAEIAAIVQAALPAPQVAKFRAELRGLIDRYLVAHPTLSAPFERFFATYLLTLAPKGLAPGSQYRVLKRLIDATRELDTNFGTQTQGSNCAFEVEKTLIKIYKPELLLQYMTNELINAKPQQKAEMMPDLMDETLGNLAGTPDRSKGMTTSEFRVLTENVLGLTPVRTQTLPETNTALDKASNAYFKTTLMGLKPTILAEVGPHRVMTLSVMSSASSTLAHKLMVGSFGGKVQIYDPGYGTVSSIDAIARAPFTEYGKVITWEVYAMPITA